MHVSRLGAEAYESRTGTLSFRVGGESTCWELQSALVQPGSGLETTGRG